MSLAEDLATIAEQCCSFELSCNLERTYYEEVPSGCRYELMVHWRTPVCFNDYKGDTVHDVVEQAMKDLPGRPWMPAEKGPQP